MAEITEKSTTEEVSDFAEQVFKEVETERAAEPDKGDARITSEHANNEQPKPKETPVASGEAAKSDDVDRIKAAVHELEQASHALSKTLYEKAGSQAQAASGSGGPQPDAQPSATPAGDDDTIDAEFEVKE